MDYIAYSIVYYIVFIFASVFFSAADRSADNKTIKRMIIAGILILSVFGGIRGISVGTDTATVVHYRYDNARLYSNWRSILKPGNEPFLTLLGWIIKNTINNYKAYLFTLQLLFEIPIGIIAYKLRKKVNITGIMAVFMLMFFQQSLNLHKQSIAVAWLLLAVIYFREGKRLLSVLLAAFASLAHGTVFMGVALFAVVFILCTSKRRIVRLMIVMLSAGIGIILFLNWRSFANIILSSDRLTDDYTGYLSIMAGESGLRYTSFHYKTYISLVLRIGGIILIIISFLKSKRRYDPDIRFFMYCTGLGFIIYSIFIIAFHMYIGDRFTVYLDACQMVLVPLIIGKTELLSQKKRKMLTVRISTSGPYLVYWFYFIYNFVYFMIVNYGKTLPYLI